MARVSTSERSLAAAAMAVTAADHERAAPQRVYLTCCVRLSPEKGALRFVEALELIGAQRLAELGVTPALCGSASDAAYGAEVRRRLRAAVPTAHIEERFLAGADLARLLMATRVNVHPALNDAYGMTLVEAAAFGTPSLVSDDGSVGAVDLFTQRSEIMEEQVQAVLATAPPASEAALLLADVSTSQALADAVLRVLRDPCKLDLVGQRAQAFALGWDEASFGHALHTVLQRHR